MKVDAMQWRFCKAISCKQLARTECQAEKCEHPDKAKALVERRDQLKAVKYGS